MCPSVTEGGGDATSGSETEGEEQKDRLAAEPGAFSSTVEGKMFEYMQQLVDNARGLQVEQAAQAQGRTGASLRAHINTCFTTNTEDGTRSKLGDWILYVKIVHDGKVPSITEVIWPPSKDAWLLFLYEGRAKLMSVTLPTNTGANTSSCW